MRSASSNTKSAKVAGSKVLASKAGASGRSVLISLGSSHIANWSVDPVALSQATAEPIAVSMHSFTASGPANWCRSLKSVMLFMLLLP